MLHRQDFAATAAAFLVCFASTGDAANLLCPSALQAVWADGNGDWKERNNCQFACLPACLPACLFSSLTPSHSCDSHSIRAWTAQTTTKRY